MSSADSEERLEEARLIHEKINKLVKDEETGKVDMARVIMILAGLLTETLVEYEEPDAVMEQTFYRVADLLDAEPVEGELGPNVMPPAYDIDRDTELGRKLARFSAERLPKELDDIHEIAIAFVISDFPQWDKENGQSTELSFRILIECVIASLTFEMAAQDFCDVLIEDFIAEGWPVDRALHAMAALAGVYLQEAIGLKLAGGSELEDGLVMVMANEAARHGVKGGRDWRGLDIANDQQESDLADFVAELRPSIEEFFEMVELDDPLFRAVAVGKSAGRMVAVTSVEEVGHLQAPVAKSLARTGMIQGMRLNDGA